MLGMPEIELLQLMRRPLDEGDLPDLFDRALLATWPALRRICMFRLNLCVLRALGVPIDPSAVCKKLWTPLTFGGKHPFNTEWISLRLAEALFTQRAFDFAENSIYRCIHAFVQAKSARRRIKADVDFADLIVFSMIDLCRVWCCILVLHPAPNTVVNPISFLSHLKSPCDLVQTAVNYANAVFFPNRIADGAKLMRCGRCKAARYCSRACQRSAWKEHKANCVDVFRSA
ncbi:hypothetical protein DFJ74DRAFT_720154 [Hyaloraphidium curvatum]|nr:hypothetical protein DFJ74DRAFT_720154 [Hyaloraphidium curvatum]